MDGKEEARQELLAEKKAGLWSHEADFDSDATEVIENYDTVIVQDDNLDGFEEFHK